MTSDKYFVMIDYDNDIVDQLFTSKVASDPSYAVPGPYGLNPLYDNQTEGQKRLLCFIEILRAYMGAIESNEEAKLAIDIFNRIQPLMRIGLKNSPTQGDGARFIAVHALATRLVYYRLPD